MRIRDFLQMAKTLGLNVVNSLTLTFTAEGFPALKFSGEGLMNLHQNSILLSEFIATGFNERRILYIDFKHELHFVEQSERTKVCLASLDEIDDAIATVKDRGTSSSHQQLVLVDMLLAIKGMVQDARSGFLMIPNIAIYNAMSDNKDDEEMTSSEQLEQYFTVIRQLRLQTYPIFESLIDLVPGGFVKTRAQEQFAQGLKTVQLDSSAVEANWEILPAEA
jgi:hypothetical protein